MDRISRRITRLFVGNFICLPEQQVVTFHKGAAEPRVVISK